MAFIDLSFRVTGDALPLDHSYALYAAISRVLGPQLHDAPNLGIFAVRGQIVGGGLLRLVEGSRLRIRAHTDHIPHLLALAGKALEVDGHKFRVGVPAIFPLVPSATLKSHLVVIKLAEPRVRGDGGRCIEDPQLSRVLPEKKQLAAGTKDRSLVSPEAFMASLCKKLHEGPPAGLGLSPAVEASIPVRRTGAYAGEPTRRVLRIKDKQVVGYAVMLSGLTAEESVKVQEEGIGGRRHMGCGLFLPTKAGEDQA